METCLSLQYQEAEMKIKAYAGKIEPEIYEIYRSIHEKPELGLKERNTSQLIRENLGKYLPQEDILSFSETGILAVVRGEQEGEGRCLLLRADMDALPIQEDETHEPKSQVPGVMHACGHDAHTAILLGTLRMMVQHKAEFAGKIYFLFQPAEEVLGGAKLFLQSNVVDLNEIHAVAACHMIPNLYGGEIGIRPGAMLASADEFTIQIHGKGGHGAHPYTTVDPVSISAGIIEEVQKLVSRETNALDTAVVSICSIHSDGDSFNIIPDRVTLKGTIRTMDESVRIRLKKRIGQISEGMAQMNNGEATVVFQEGPPAFINDPEWEAGIEPVLASLLGKEKIKHEDTVTMGAEDFAFIKERYPGIFIRIGCRTEGAEFTPIHSGRFRVDRKALLTGMITMSGVAAEFFGMGTEETDDL